MDVFVEQLFERRIKPKELLLKVVLFAVCAMTAGVLTLLLFTFMGGRFFIFTFLIVPAMMYLAFYLSSRFNVEIEYSLTNGAFDVDTIINRRKRNRIASFDCKDIESFGKYNDSQNYNCKNIIYAANEDAEDKYYFIYQDKNKGKCLLVIEPNEKMIKGLKRCLPRQIVYNIFGSNI